MKKIISRRVPFQLYYLLCILEDISGWNFAEFPEVQKGFNDLKGVLSRCLDSFREDIDFNKYDICKTVFTVLYKEI